MTKEQKDALKNLNYFLKNTPKEEIINRLNEINKKYENSNSPKIKDILKQLNNL